MRREVSRRGLLAGSGGLVVGGWLLGSLGPLESSVAAAVAAEDGYELWLRYRLVRPTDLLEAYQRALTHVVDPGVDGVLRSAADELVGGLTALLGQDIPERPRPAGAGAVILGTPDSSSYVSELADADELRRLGPEGYVLRRTRLDGAEVVLIASAGERGVLYGAFHLLRLLQTHQAVEALDVAERPANPLRLANHWDNLNRTVERGYAGDSIFHWDELPSPRPRYTDYARTLASIGMNGAVVNNVNAQADFLSSELIEGLAGLAGVFRPWGVTLYLSANFASPMTLDGLDTADPFDPGVQAWWRAKADEVYRAIPDFGGFLVKANSEGQPGPLDYGRTHADGANLIADAVRPHGGIVMWRAFIHEFDADTWAHMAYETFQPLDGEFADNAIVQMKNGPIDFQVREPIHPLFGALPRTNSMLELQVTQEYTGHSTHLCYVVPQWKQVYDFDTHAEGAGTTVASIVDGSTYGYSHSGVAGVMNFGSDINWTGHHLAAANTHGYGRLAWNPRLGAAELAEEWVRMTFGSHPRVIDVLTRMLLSSWETYEDYTSPLGSGFMIGDSEHFNPGPYGNQGWHRSDAEGTGYDRTAATGNGYTELYHPPVTALYESLESCPDELLMFFHHVPWGYRLNSGKTVIQHIYDTHFEGLEAVRKSRGQWRALRSYVDSRRYEEVLERLDWQVEHAALWRDVLVGYFFEVGKRLDERRSWLQTRFVPSAIVLLGGVTNRVELSVGNASGRAHEISAGLRPLDGWSSGTGSVSVPSREFRTLSVPVRPPATGAGLVTLRAELDAGDVDLLDRGATRTGVDVVLTPDGSRSVLALDGGADESPLLEGYERLSPADTWDPARGFGWVGDAPQSRDRGGRLDVLRRDFVNDTTTRVLRVAVPSGTHDAYLLVGDVHPSFPTFVHADGELLAESEYLPGGSFTWLAFTLDGGNGGRDIDLELSSVPGEHWHLGALAIL